jgi:hypothetical protein
MNAQWSLVRKRSAAQSRCLIFHTNILSRLLIVFAVHSDKISVTEPRLRCEADRLNYQAEWIKVGLGEISVAREAELANH